jgi:hypothetical protein
MFTETDVLAVPRLRPSSESHACAARRSGGASKRAWRSGGTTPSRHVNVCNSCSVMHNVVWPKWTTGWQILIGVAAYNFCIFL